MDSKLMSENFIIKLKTLIPVIKEDIFTEDFKNTLAVFFESGYFLDKERMNILLSYWDLPPMSDHFYSYYFKGVLNSEDDFAKGINNFIRDALWHYGDLEIAYNDLVETNDIAEVFKWHSFDQSEFKSRLRWNLIKPIPPDERGLLGYVSGQRPFREQSALSRAEEIIKELEDHPGDYSGLQDSKQIANKVLEKLKLKNPDIQKSVDEIFTIEKLKGVDLFNSEHLEINKKIIEKTKVEIEETITKVINAKEIGRVNQEQYLRNIEKIDVYVATSMRDDKEYNEMTDFVDKVFHNVNLSELNIRYFDPTLCYCDSRIDKGIIECLLVRTAKVTIYCAQDGDTFGKDSELAASLVQGKPVIVYVPKGNTPEEMDKLNRRASIFSEFHPLGLQVGLYDGVARGIIVVRSPDDCASILAQIFTNSLETKVTFEEHGIVLRDKLTGSVLRAMSGWKLLSNAFWNNFDKTKNPKSGNCI